MHRLLNNGSCIMRRNNCVHFLNHWILILLSICGDAIRKKQIFLSKRFKNRFLKRMGIYSGVPKKYIHILRKEKKCARPPGSSLMHITYIIHRSTSLKMCIHFFWHPLYFINHHESSAIDVPKINANSYLTKYYPNLKKAYEYFLCKII